MVESVTFRSLTMADVIEGERLKRETSVDVMGEDIMDVLFPPARPYVSYLGEILDFSPNSAAFMCFGNAHIGYVEVRRLSLDTTTAVWANAYVIPEWRGRGLGKHQADYVENWSRVHNMTRVIVRTNSLQLKVVDFYERCGYVKHADIKALAGQPMIEMEKRLAE